MVVFVGCEQEEFDLQSENSYDATTQRIVDFGSSLTKKSGNGDNMHIDSLVWYSEAWFNLNYGYPHLDYENVTTDSMKITIDLLESGMVAADVVASTHIDMNNFIVKQYDNFLDEPKHMISMNVSLRNLTATQAELWLHSTIGKVVDAPETKSDVLDPFKYYDWWHVIEGRCNGYQAEFPSDENAAYQLLDYYRSHNSDFAYLNSPWVYFTDQPNPWEYPDVIWDNTWNNDPETQDLYPTLVYGPSYDRTCLSPEDLYFFLSKMDDVLIHNRPGPDEFADLYPYNIDIEITGDVGQGSHTEYGYEFELGERHYSERPREDPALMHE